MKNLRRHILRSLMGVAGLLTFTACYGPYIPPEDMEYPKPEDNTAVTVQDEGQIKAEEEPDADVTAEL